MKVDWMSEMPVAFLSINKEVGSPKLKWFAFVVYEAKISGKFIPIQESDESQEAKYFRIDEARQL